MKNNAMACNHHSVIKTRKDKYRGCVYENTLALGEGVSMKNLGHRCGEGRL